VQEPARRTLARFRRADLVVLIGYELLFLCGFLPWFRVLDVSVRPIDLPLAALPGVAFVLLALLVLAPVRIAGVGVLQPLPFGLGCLLLGMAVGLIAATIAVNAAVTNILGAETGRLAGGLGGWTRVPGLGPFVERLQAGLLELPERLRVELQVGLGLFALASGVLIAAGYRKLVHPVVGGRQTAAQSVDESSPAAQIRGPD
jgi:hypothetical protein